MRRLTGDAYLSPEFATTWRTYELDGKTSALLAYASKLTETPALLEARDFDALRSAGWDDGAIYDATALVAFFNLTGRLEAAAGLPPDTIADDAQPPEVRERR